jgi:hypothetical protein
MAKSKKTTVKKSKTAETLSDWKFDPEKKPLRHGVSGKLLLLYATAGEEWPELQETLNEFGFESIDSEGVYDAFKIGEVLGKVESFNEIMGLVTWASNAIKLVPPPRFDASESLSAALLHFFNTVTISLYRELHYNTVADFRPFEATLNGNTIELYSNSPYPNVLDGALAHAYAKEIAKQLDSVKGTNIAETISIEYRTNIAKGASRQGFFIISWKDC